MGSKRDFVYYLISGTVVGWVASLFGANLMVVLFVSTLVPPILLVIYRLII